MQSLKTKVAAEKAAQGASEENDGARRKLRKAVAARDAAYALDDGAEALLSARSTDGSRRRSAPRTTPCTGRARTRRCRPSTDSGVWRGAGASTCRGCRPPRPGADKREEDYRVAPGAPDVKNGVICT